MSVMLQECNNYVDGAVRKCKWPQAGLTCMGKKMHCRLYEYPSPNEGAEMLQCFEEECELLSRLIHAEHWRGAHTYIVPSGQHR